MIAFALREIVLAIFSFLLFGVLFGILYSVSDLLREILGRMLLLIPYAYISVVKKEKSIEVSSGRFRKNKILEGIYEALIILIIGIILIFLYYIYLDSSFRVYPLVFLGAGFYVAKRYIGDYCYKALLVVFDKTYGIMFFLTKYIVTPPYLLFLFCKRLAAKIYRPIQKHCATRYSDRITERKKREVNIIFYLLDKNKVRPT